jgi:hypothetical protein
MSVQTTYTRLTDARMHGSLSDLNENEIQSAAAEVAIPVGVAVTRGTDPENQVILAADADFLGIAIRDLSREGVINTGLLDYKIGEMVSVLRSGRINLTCATGCTAGDAANYNDTTGVIDSGAAGAGETDIGGAVWETTTAAGEVGVLRLPDTVTIA